MSVLGEKADIPTGDWVLVGQTVRSVVTVVQFTQLLLLETVGSVAENVSAKSPRRLAMVTEMNISQFKTWLNDARPDDLVTIAPLLFSRIGTLDKTHQERFIKEIQQNPQAKTVFQKLQVANQ